ncbi:hypothetical protein H2201_002875 [Coniosporium apollinis]|uniref:Uncharacterized protein n=1 Tax=Coniosporium apollinis TaxID=61459 RepID=A0ABQ9P165_9PEZI|nr:hypothetical protein H2201_002875 [Coniosporium apollinis]
MATFGLKRSSVTSSSATQQSIHEQASHQSSFSSTSPAQDLAQPPIPLTSENLGAPSPVPRPTVHTKVEPIQLVPGHPVRSLISTISPPTRFHTSRIHVKLSYDQALSIASTDDLLQQDSDEVEAKAEVQVCAEWLSGEETEIINDRPGEVDLAAAWTCKRLDGALLNSDGLLLRKGKDLLKLSVEAS